MITQKILKIIQYRVTDFVYFKYRFIWVGFNIRRTLDTDFRLYHSLTIANRFINLHLPF